MSGAVSLLGGKANVFKATLNRLYLSGFNYYTPSTSQTFQSITCKAVGGRPPYTYLWSRVSGDTAMGNTSSTNTTYFARYFATDGEASSIWHCTITDSLGATAVSDPFQVDLSAYGTVE